jgi:F-type H+-transporting ATPase subunit alpha
MPAEEQVAVIYAGVNGYLDRLRVADVTRFEQGLLSELRASGREILDAIRDTGALSQETEQKLRSLIDRYAEAFA